MAKTELTRIELEVPLGESYKPTDVERLITAGTKWRADWLEKNPKSTLEYWKCGVMYGERTDGSKHPLGFFRGEADIDFSNIPGVHRVEDALGNLATVVAKMFPKPIGSTGYATRIGDLPRVGSTMRKS